ncbi:MAG: BON domain-containing protein [Bdellovibrionales bacterium]
MINKKNFFFALGSVLMFSSSLMAKTETRQVAQNTQNNLQTTPSQGIQTVPQTLSTPQTPFPQVVPPPQTSHVYVPTPEDTALNRRVMQDLRTNVPTDNLNNVNITSTGGRVIIEGVVNSQSEADRILERARTMNGVTAVENKLSVGPTVTPTR